MNTSSSQKPLCTNGFTLIEMVVVITILILLTTAAFVSYSDYSSSARDSNRVSDLSGFYGALETYKAKVGELPDPSSGVSVLSGSTTELAKQGYLGTDILAKIGVDRGGEDPRSGLYYTYLVNSNKDKAQLLGFFEGAGFENKLAFGVVPQAYALSDNSTLFPATTGKKLGVFLLSATKSPIQEAFSGSVTLTSLVSSGTIISGSCLSLSGSTTSSTMTGTLTLTGGTNLASCYVSTNYCIVGGSTSCVATSAVVNPYASCTSAWQTYTGTTTYPGCDEADKIVCTGNGVGYTWAMCNVGSTSRYYYGNLFQWWRNTPFVPGNSGVPIWTTTQWPLSLIAANATSNFITSYSWNYDWLTPQDSNRWWASSNPTTITWVTATNENQVLMRWPCSDWYHVPTQKEAIDIRPYYANISGLDRVSINYYNWVFDNQNSDSFLWLSSPSWVEGTVLRAWFISSMSRAYGFAVRCLKN